MTYPEKLLSTKAGYPFDTWRGYYPNQENNFDGMEQYTADGQGISDEWREW